MLISQERVTNELEADVISSSCGIGIEGDLFEPGDFATLVTVEIMVRVAIACEMLERCLIHNDVTG